MRNLTFPQWAYAMMALLLLGNVAKTLGWTTLDLISAIGLGLLAVERITNLLRVRRLCGQNPRGDHEHACALPHGHPRDMHACRHGDCSWGSYAVNPDSVK
jgi:hypothetical protein